MLEDVHSMLRQVQDAAGYDIHCISAEAQAALASIEVESNTRPQSVASVHLEDPHVYQRRNVAKMEYVGVDEWPDRSPVGYR